MFLLLSSPRSITAALSHRCIPRATVLHPGISSTRPPSSLQFVLREAPPSIESTALGVSPDGRRICIRLHKFCPIQSAQSPNPRADESGRSCFVDGEHVKVINGEHVKVIDGGHVSSSISVPNLLSSFRSELARHTRWSKVKGVIPLMVSAFLLLARLLWITMSTPADLGDKRRFEASRTWWMEQGGTRS